MKQNQNGKLLKRKRHKGDSHGNDNIHYYTR